MSEGIAPGEPPDRRPSTPARRRIAAFFVIALAAIGIVATATAYVSLFGPGSGLPGEPLTIVTEPEPPTSGACLLARLGGVEMHHVGQTVVFDEGIGGHIGITWPYGTKARLVDGHAELFASNGIRIGIEGKTLPAFAGGLGTDDRFHVCGVEGMLM